ncbi:hypothetical protein [Streptomyces sp. JH34]|uniref:hypothetical protein n=1 Tax=Streptomyces sp. JH34 TaxID=2793633 RepID=UPI0023F65E0C|nr:hypothetical protein [Streptomyces sp. JH34]MDF6018232.1 hypothetical protein [Streptomyces sp. JH34]
MEQRIDSKTKPEFAAGTDPAYIPGLTAPAPARTEAEAEKAEPAEPEAAEAAEAPAEGAADEAVDDVTAVADADPDDIASPDVEEKGDADEKAGADEKTGAGDGPVFEVSDRRGSIRVDAEGVRFRLDDQEAEFDWSEIGAVEVTTGRFGRRFTVTVHVSSRRWFNAEVEAAARSDLKKWTAELDEALDAYFEEA